jgi:7,8-dihydroneopterin aldolase/epimerase/oxygenase
LLDLTDGTRMTDLNVIRLKNAVFYAYHGAMEDEQNLGGKFECDVDMHCDLSAAAESDSLKKTVDYERVYAYIQNVVLEKKYYLLEALANSIAKGLLREFFALEKVMVRIRKPHPPVRGVVDYVEVEITRQR